MLVGTGGSVGGGGSVAMPITFGVDVTTVNAPPVAPTGITVGGGDGKGVGTVSRQAENDKTPHNIVIASIWFLISFSPSRNGRSQGNRCTMHDQRVR
ncbi:MAG: hypothetical protein ACE5E7_07495 [Anaerolineae bacterium]